MLGVIQVGIMLLVLLSDLVVLIALSDQYPDIRVRRELST